LLAIWAPCQLVGSLAQCQLMGCLAHCLLSDSLLPPWLIAGSWVAWLSDSADFLLIVGSLVPCCIAPWLNAGSQGAWLFAGSLSIAGSLGSLVPWLLYCWLLGSLPAHGVPGSLPVHGVPGSLLALTHYCLPVTLTFWLIAGSPGSLLVPWLLVGSLAQCWLTGCLAHCRFTGCLAHCWHSDSLLPPCHLANSQAHCWLSGLLAGSIIRSLAPRWPHGFELAPWLNACSRGAWLIAGSLTHC